MNKSMFLLFAGFIFCLGLLLYGEHQQPAEDTPPQNTETVIQPEEPAAEVPPAETPPDKQLPPTPEEPEQPASPVIEGEYQVPEESLADKIMADTSQGFIAVTDTTHPNHELQTYLPGQETFSGSHILLRADRLDQQYVSAKVESIRAFRYGTFSFRIKVLRGSGLFPAIWMLPASKEEFPEIDIYEMIGSYPQDVHGVLHYLHPDTGKQSRDFFRHRLTSVPEYYDITFEWAPDHMTWYLNGNKRMTVTENIPNAPMYIIMNLAVGGNWPGNPGTDTVFPATLDVELLDFRPEEIFLR